MGAETVEASVAAAAIVAVASEVAAAGGAGTTAGCLRGCFDVRRNAYHRNAWGRRGVRGEVGFLVKLAGRVCAGRMKMPPSLSDAVQEEDVQGPPLTPPLRARPSDGPGRMCG